VKWDIAVRGGVWTANVAPDSPHGYLNTFQTFDDQERRNGDGKPFKIVHWVLNEDMPFLAGKLSDIQPRAAIESFGTTNKNTIRVRDDVQVSVTVKKDKADMSGVLVLLGIIAIAWYADKPKRGRRR
jgi:hypothetical protein